MLATVSKYKDCITNVEQPKNLKGRDRYVLSNSHCADCFYYYFFVLSPIR